MAWFQVNFFSECLSRSVMLNVLIPSDNLAPETALERVDHYSTLYLLHGIFGNCADWILNGQVNALSERYNLAVVMPSGNNGFYVDQPSAGLLGSTFVGQELVEFTHKIFPLSQAREDTIIGGLSMGGYGALYNGLRHSEVFGHVVAMSPPLSFDQIEDPAGENLETELGSGYFEAIFGDLESFGASEKNVAVLAKNLFGSGRLLPELYLACGYNDRLVYDSRAFSAALDEMGFEHVYEEGPGTHEWPFWNTYLRRGLEHIFPDLPAPPPNPFWIDGGIAEGGV